MRVERFGPDGAAAIRGLAPAPAGVASEVAQITEGVRQGGDAALRSYAERFDGVREGSLRVSTHELDAAAARLRTDVRCGLEIAMANVAAVAGASLGDDAELGLPQGQRVLVREFPVRRAAIYVPGGRAPYPSTVIMGVVTARVAGVEEIVVLTPGGHEVILGACALCGIDEVYRFGGAHGIAALAHGTETIERADVIAGPGGPFVQEAKRLVSAEVGIDGYLGPSDVFVVASAGADPDLVALDLLAQAEHGEGTIVAVASDQPEILDAAERALRDFHSDAAGAVVEVSGPEEGLEVAEAFAPEHLELVGERAESLAPRVRRAGCVFVGRSGGTAFGDYVAGSNHSLPTGGSARFGSALSVRHFRRRMAEVHVAGAAGALAKAGAPVARAEGYELHARSMEARQNGGRR